MPTPAPGRPFSAGTSMILALASWSSSLISSANEARLLFAWTRSAASTGITGQSHLSSPFAPNQLHHFVQLPVDDIHRRFVPWATATILSLGFTLPSSWLDRFNSWILQ